MIGLKDVPMEPEDLWGDNWNIPKLWINSEDDSGYSSYRNLSLSDDKLNIIK